ncbi:MAG: hypothetical protein ACSLEL_04685 [Candidatus Malihini olakiniferum]
MRVRSGDLNGQGALLIRNLIQGISGDIINEGSIAGCEFVQLSRNNLEQKKAIQDKHVILDAQKDILNINKTYSHR